MFFINVCILILNVWFAVMCIFDGNVVGYVASVIGAIIMIYRLVVGENE